MAGHAPAPSRGLLDSCHTRGPSTPHSLPRYSSRGCHTSDLHLAPGSGSLPNGTRRVFDRAAKATTHNTENKNTRSEGCSLQIPAPARGRPPPPVCTPPTVLPWGSRGSTAPEASCPPLGASGLVPLLPEAPAPPPAPRLPRTRRTPAPELGLGVPCGWLWWPCTGSSSPSVRLPPPGEDGTKGLLPPVRPRPFLPPLRTTSPKILSKGRSAFPLISSTPPPPSSETVFKSSLRSHRLVLKLRRPARSCSATTSDATHSGPN